MSKKSPKEEWEGCPSETLAEAWSFLPYRQRDGLLRKLRGDNPSHENVSNIEILLRLFETEAEMVISLAGYSQDEIEDHVFLKDLLRFCERHPGNQLGVVKGLELLAASRVVACTKRIRECAAQGNVEGVFLETIYLAGLNIRSRRHSKIIIGENTLNLRSKGGKARSMKVSEEASKKHAQWKAEAKKILARKPKASKSQVALYVKSKLKLEQSIQTIRKNI